MKAYSDSVVIISLILSLLVMLCSLFVNRWLGLPSFAIVPTGVSMVLLTCYPVAQMLYKRAGANLSLRAWAGQTLFTGSVMLLVFYIAGY